MKPRELLSDLNLESPRQYLLLTLILVSVAAVLRLSGLGFSYSNDELSALLRVQYSSFPDLVDKGFYVDGHPGGIQVFLYYWVKIFGMNEWIVRLPFALAGAAAVYFAIRLFSGWFGQTTGLLTGAFMAFLEFPLVYSQIARPYGAGLLFSMLMAWFWTRLLFDEKPKALTAAGYALSTAACMYDHYFSFLLALIMGVCGLFYLNRKTTPYYIGAGLAAVLMFSPHIYITLNHLRIGGVGLWLAKPGYNWLLLHIWTILNQSVIIAGIAGLIALVPLILYPGRLHFSRFHLFAALFFIVPFITGFYYSRLVNPVLQNSVLIFSFPFFLAFLFSFAGRIPSAPATVLVVVVLIAGSSQTIFGNHYYSKQHFGEFRGIAAAIGDWNRIYGAKNITRAVNVNNPWYLNFYLDRGGYPRTRFSQTENRGDAQLDSLSALLDRCTTKYFMYAWTKPAPEDINDMIRARFPCIVSSIDYEGLSNATLYEAGPDRCSDQVPDTLIRIIPLQNPEPAMGIDISNIEYSPGYDGTYSGLMQNHRGRLVAGAEILTDTAACQAVLVVSFHNNAGETIHYLGARSGLFQRPGRWSTIRKTIRIPDEVPPGSRMKVYIWNPHKCKLMIRNFAITLENAD